MSIITVGTVEKVPRSIQFPLILGSKRLNYFFPSIFFQDHVGEVLSRTGVLILVIGLCVLSSFLLAALVVPVPGMRDFSAQAAALAAFNLASMLLIFPAALAVDVRRAAASRLDLLCCYTAKKDKKGFAELLGLGKKSGEDEEGNPETEVAMRNEEERKDEEDKGLFEMAAERYSRWLAMPRVKYAVTLTQLVLIVAGVWGATKVEDGLDLVEVVPRNTSIHSFLEAQDKYFGFYNMYAVTEGNFEYPQQQALLYDYHNAFVRVPSVIKDDNGGLPEFWLSLFRAWLVKVQDVFDDAFAAGVYTDKGWNVNATEEAVLAFKLMVQTGHVDYPVDLTLQTRNRLVDAHGVINPAAFYNYLSAWYSNDAMAYSFSQASLVPKPREWLHNPLDHELRVPKSAPIAYAQIPFYLNNLGHTGAVVDAVTQVRDICERFSAERGLPNFPRGVPFTFWEQYVNLRLWLGVVLALVVLAAFLVLSVVFVSARTAAVGVFVIACVLLQLFGFMGLVGLKLSAIPVVMLILAVAVAVQLSVHILMVSLNDRICC